MLVVCEAKAAMSVMCSMRPGNVFLSTGHMARVCAILAVTVVCLPRLIRSMRACLRNMVDNRNIWLYSPPPPETAALRALHARRTEIQQMLIAETGRLDHAQHKSVLKSLKDHIASLKAALAAIEADIAQLVEECEVLRKKVALMQTVIGIGPISAMVVLAYLPDIGRFTTKANTHGLQDWHL